MAVVIKCLELVKGDLLNARPGEPVHVVFATLSLLKDYEWSSAVFDSINMLSTVSLII